MPTESQSFLKQMQQVDALVAAVEQGTDPAARAAAQDLVRSLLDVHAAALARMLELLSESGRQSCAEDELVSHVLLLHGLHPVDLEARVLQALESIRPLLRRGGGELEIIAVNAERVRVRVEAAAGCGTTVAALKGAVQRAIFDAAPEVDTVEVEGIVDSEPALMQVGLLSRSDHLAEPVAIH